MRSRMERRVEISLRPIATHGWRGVAALTVALITLSALAGMAGGAEGDASPSSGQAPFHEVMHGSRANNLPGENLRAAGRVLRSAAQARRVLRAWDLDLAAAKSVDFRREALIVVLAAYQPTGGYRARVSGVAVRGDEAVVTANVRSEGGEITTQSIERPWVVIALKRAALAGVRSAVRLQLR
jgi:PrcB C-terminal